MREPTPPAPLTRQEFLDATAVLACSNGRPWRVCPRDPRIVVEGADGNERTVAAFLRPEEAELAVMCRNLLPRVL